ncbi:nuclear transport factor 2 family protein [Burkholderia alba]|uniref:nuclear transport factor 2 family protein n=1 Tax=Burkholderia alba TaxID=2683677 RepID=UPI002B059362|nr:nuclear transport factor 2 family protein [Burkholderia alba]
MQGHQAYLDEVVAGCDAIQDWLAGVSASDAALDAVMAHFAPHFTMIGTDGGLYDHAAMRALFVRIAGRKPGLRITFSDTRVLAAYPAGAVVSYCEHQTDASGVLPARRATVVFERDAATGTVHWAHLQETFCVA